MVCSDACKGLKTFIVHYRGLFVVVTFIRYDGQFSGLECHNRVLLYLKVFCFYLKGSNRGISPDFFLESFEGSAAY